MKLFVGVTNNDWFRYLAARKPDEVNFWRPRSQMEFRALTPGDIFLFKLHSPLDYIAGGGVYLPRLRRWKKSGYRIEIVYLKLSDVRLSIERIASRVRSGGHHVPETDARRRYTRSWANLNAHYLPLANAAWVFDVSGPAPILVHETP